MAGRPSTPPRRQSNGAEAGPSAAAGPPTTPEHVRIMQENRLRAKARIQQQAAAMNPSARLNALGKRPQGPLTMEPAAQSKEQQQQNQQQQQLLGPNGNLRGIPSTTRNANLDMEATRVSPVKKAAPGSLHGSTMATAGAIDDPNVPLPRDKSLGNYIEFDLSKLHNSKGGFLVDEEDNAGFNNKGKSEEEIRAERERQRERLQQTMDPGVNLSEQAKCRECGSRDLDDQIRTVFAIFVCRGCEKRLPEKYSLLTKTEVREDYLLTDAELRDAELLPHLLKANPHKSTYSNMMLYLRCQVESYAFSPARWGSEEGLDAEFARREEEKAKRREGKFLKGLSDLRKRTRDNVWEKRQAEKHICQFDDMEGTAGRKQRCSQCGFIIDVDVY